MQKISTTSIVSVMTKDFAGDVLKYKFNKLLHFDLNFTCICSHSSNEEYGSLVPHMKQAIIWTNNGLVYWCTYPSLNPNELK